MRRKTKIGETKIFQNKFLKSAIFGLAAFLILLTLSFAGKSSASVLKQFNYQGRLTDAAGTDKADGQYDMEFKIYTVAGGAGAALWTETWSSAALWTSAGGNTIIDGDGGNGCATGTKKISYGTTTNEGTLAAGQQIWNSTVKENSVIATVTTASDYLCAYTPLSTWNNGDTLTNLIYVKGAIFNVQLGSVTPMNVDFTSGEYWLGVKVGADSEMVPRKKIGAVPEAINANNLVGDGNINLSNTSPAQDAASITYNPTSGANNALSITYGSAGGSGAALKVTQSGTGEIIGAYNGSNEYFTVKNSGNTGIGYADPGTAKLAVNGNVGIGTTAPSARLTLQGTNSEATLGAEQITTSDDQTFTTDTGQWTKGTNWLIDNADSNLAAHTAGTTGTLSLANTYVDPDPVAGSVYKITFTVNTTTVGTLTASFGGAGCSDVGQSVETLYGYTCVVTATNTNALTFTPDAAWAGTLDNISVMLITPSNSLATLNNSNGTTGLEIRSGGASSFFIGYQAGRANTGLYNSALGYRALWSNTTSGANSAVGYQALYSNTTGAANSALGYQALYTNTYGNNNSAVGYQALQYNTTGAANSALGYQASNFNSTGSYNSTLGTNALALNNTGSYNTAIGYAAGSGTRTGSNNTLLGSKAGFGVAFNSYSNNTIIGYQAGLALTTGSNNILLGYQAGDALTSGGTNIAIGYDLDLPSNTTSSQLTIGNLIFASGGFGTGTTVGAGNVGIGTTAVSNTKLAIKETVTEASLGAEKAINGLFATNGTWTWGTGWAWDGTNFEADHTIGNTADLEENVSAVIGETYQVVFTVRNMTAGSVTPKVGGANGAAVTSNTTTMTQLITAVSTANLKFTPSTDFDGSIDDVTVMKVTFSNSGLALLNSNNTTGLEIRSGGASSYNTFVGIYAGRATYHVASNTGYYNSALGASALSSNTTGSMNSALGSGALFSNTTGSYNSVVGYGALSSNTTGSMNSALGLSALLFNTTGSSNSAVGSGALASNTTGGWNSAVGVSALGGNTTGNYNTALGEEAGYNNLTGASNVFLGYKAGYNETGSNKLYIANSDTTSLIYGDFSTGQVGIGGTAASTNPYLYISSGGNVGIGTTALGNKLTISGGVGIGTTAPGSVYLSTAAPDGGMIIEGNVGIGTTDPSQALELGPSKWLSFEGATEDTVETILQVTDPTSSDKTITFQDNSGIVPLSTAGNTLFFTTSGSTSLTLPTGPGTVALTSDLHTQNTDTGTSGTSFTVGDGSTTFTVDTAAADDSLTIEQGTYDSLVTFTQNLSAGQTYAFTTGGTVCTTGGVCSGYSASHTHPYLSDSTSSTQSGYFGDVYLYDDGTPSNYLQITNSGNLTGAHSLSINTNDADRTVSLSGNLVVSADASVSNTNTGDQFTNTTASVLLGRGSAGGAGAAQEITLGTNLSMSGTTLNATGGGNPAWNSIQVPTGNLTLAMDADTTTFNWDTLTTQTAWTFGSAAVAATSYDLVKIHHTASMDDATAVSGNLLDIARSLTIDIGGARSITVSSPVVSISDNCTQGASDTCTHTGDVLALTQSFTGSTGNVLLITNSGAGYGLRVNDDGTITDASPFVVNSDGNVGVGTAPVYKLDVLTSIASDRAVNILQNATSGSNYGVYATVTPSSGTPTLSVGGYFAATGSTTNYGFQVAAMTGATSYGLTIGALSGGTANRGVDIGNMSGLLNTGVNVGTMSGNTTNYGFNLTAITVTGAATNVGVNIGAISGSTSGNNTGLAVGAVSGTATANKGISVGVINSSNATNSYGIDIAAMGGTGVATGINLAAITASGATNYGINVGGLSGAGTTNYGINVGAVSGSTNKYGVNIAALTGAGTNNFGLAVAAPATTGTSNYGAQIGGPAGAGTSNYGLNITAPSGATHNSALTIGAVVTTSGTWAIYSNVSSNSYFLGNVGINVQPGAANRLDIATSTASDRGINIAHTATSGTNYGIYSSVTGATPTANIGGYFSASGAATNYGVQVNGFTGGATANYGLTIGAIAGTGTTNAGINIATLTSTGTTSSGVYINGLSGAATTNNGLYVGAISGATNKYGVNIAAITGAGTTSAALNIIAPTSTSTSNYGALIGGPAGAGTSNYGVNITQPTGSTHDAALEIGAVTTGAGDWAIYSNTSAVSYFLGNIGIGTTNPTQGALTVNGNMAALAQGDMLFYDTDNSNYAGFQATGVTTQNVIYTLPGSAPAADGYALVSTTGGTLSWVSAGGMTNPMTEQGDIIFGGTGGTPTRLDGSLSDGYVLKYTLASNTLSWAQDNTSAGGPTVSLSPSVADAESSVNPSIWINDSGGGDLLRLQTTASGLTTTRFSVANLGGISVNGATSNIVKTSSYDTSNPTDFQYSLAAGTAPQLYNTTAVQNTVTLKDGTVAQNYTSSSVVLPNSAGPGSHSIQRDDGQIIIIHGGTSPGTSSGTLWDGTSAGGGTAISVASAATVGRGAISLRRPNGRFLLVHANNTNASSIFDPYNRVAPVGGPNVCTTSTNFDANAFMRPDGRYVIMCGGGTTWGIYDPSSATTTGVYTAGVPTVAPGTFGLGAHALQRDDGTFLVLFGGVASTNAVFNANMIMSGQTSPWSNPNVVLAHTGSGAGTAPLVSTGAVSVRRQDGKYLIIPGPAGAAFIYDPTPNMTGTTSPYGTFTSAPAGPSAALGDGAQLLWRPDGKYILVRGGGTSDTWVVDPSVPSFTAGTALPGNINSGSHFVARQDGSYQIIAAVGAAAGGSTTTYLADMGFVMGGMVGAGTTNIPAGTTGPQLAYWESECIDASSLNPTSTLNWNTNQEGYATVQARTASSCANILSTTYKDIVASGDKINPAPGDVKIRIRVFFRRDFPNFVDQEWKLWRGLNQTRYRRRLQDPQLSDITINNSSLFHRNRFSLGSGVSTPQDPSGPVTQNVNVAGDGSLQLSQGIGNQMIASTTNPVGEAYAGQFQNHNPLNIGATGAAEGTLVMKRPDGRFTILIGSTNYSALGGTNPPAVNMAEIYDPSNSSFTNAATGVYNSTCSGTGGVTGCVPNDGANQIAVGKGSLAFKRPDGKFFIVAGAGTTTGGTAANNGFTNIYDPVAGTFATGPPLAGMTGSTAPYAGRGSMAIPLPNGNVMIIHGNYGKWTSIYNPMQNTMIPGPDTPVAIGMGAMAIPRPDGAYLLIPGTSTEACGAQAGVYTFDPFNMNFQPANTALVTGVGPGAFAFQRSDGTWVIVHGAGSATTCASTSRFQIYNPATNRLSTIAYGMGGGVLAGWGSQAMIRPDGSQLLTLGGGTTGVQMYLEKGGITMAEGTIAGTAVQIAPAILTSSVNVGTSPPGNGAVTFQRDDGKFIMIGGMLGTWGSVFYVGGTAPAIGAASANVYQYDAGWVQSGMYRTEQMNIPDLTTASTLNWKTSGPSMAGISAEVRTAQTQAGLQTASSREVTSGGAINPGSGETWIQIHFNFKRNFPGEVGPTSDVWRGSNGSLPKYYRNIPNPQLLEFKINKDADLLNLQADGLSLFRVSSNGDIYTSANGSVRTGGADLAENYSSMDPLEKGEVVSIDPITDHSVKRSLWQNQPDVLGVVSSQPGFVAGSFTKDSFPIALVGRVPVKVSTENGMVKVGDYLTASAVPGHAMRATKSGRVIGKALEALTADKLTECPPSQFPMPGRKCGMIMMFVNLTDYHGMPIDTLVAEAKNENIDISPESALAAATSADSSGTAGELSQKLSDLSSFSGYSKQAAILEFLENLRSRAPTSPYDSEIYTDRLSAGKEVITPSVFTDLLVAKSIRAEKIEGLEFIQSGLATNEGKFQNLGARLDELDAKLAGLSLALYTPRSPDDPNRPPSEAENTLYISQIKELQTKGALAVGGPAEFQGPAVFRALAEFIEKTIFQNETEFAKTARFENGMEVSGYMVLDRDSAGYAVIKKGSQNVAINFAKEYGAAPVVNANLSLEQFSDPEVRAAAEDLLLVSDVKYILTNVTTKGFEIKMDRPADSDIPFSWQAVAVKDPKTFGKDVIENLLPADGANQNPATGNLELSADQPVVLPPDAAPASDPADSGQGAPVSSAPPDSPPDKPPG